MSFFTLLFERNVPLLKTNKILCKIVLFVAHEPILGVLYFFRLN